MANSYEELMGTPMDVANHPVRSIPGETRIAGDVVNFPISLQQADSNRQKLDRVKSKVSHDYNISGDEVDNMVKRLNPGKVLLGPGATR